MTDPRPDNPFLAAITAAPADDLPRLAYADWLQDRGSPGDLALAEFVRLQVRDLPAAVEAHRRTFDASGHHCAEVSDHVYDLVRRERDLWTIVGDSFRPHVPAAMEVAPYDQGKLRAVDVGRYAFVRRGFVSTVVCPLADWYRHGPRLVAYHPVDRVVPHDALPFFVPDAPDDVNEEGGDGTWCVSALPESEGRFLIGHHRGSPTALQREHFRAGQSKALTNWARRRAGMGDLP